MYIDSHNHVAPWSVDAKQTFAEFYGKACASKLLGVGLSDHIELEHYTPDGREWNIDIPAYLEEFGSKRMGLEEAQKLGQPAFFLGLELGYLPDHEDRLEAIFATDGFDFFILSLHDLHGKDLYYDSGDIFSNPLVEVYENYLETLTHAVNRFPNANICAHFDYVSRYSTVAKPKMYYRDLGDHFDTLFRYLIDNEMAFEINTGTIDRLILKGYSLEDALPDSDIIKRYVDLGGELITVSTDSHIIEHHLRLVPETLKYLKGLGIEQLAYFENGRTKTHVY